MKKTIRFSALRNGVLRAAHHYDIQRHRDIKRGKDIWYSGDQELSPRAAAAMDLFEQENMLARTNTGKITTSSWGTDVMDMWSGRPVDNAITIQTARTSR